MKKIGKLFLYGLITLVFYFAMVDFPSLRESGLKVYPEIFEITESDTAWIENHIRNMSLEDKCAQLVMVRADSRDTSTDTESYLELLKLVKEYKIGGLIFFQGDVESQLNITNNLQKESKIPLLISSDFERGLGMRLEGAIGFPSNMAVSAAGDENLTYLMGKVIGIEARAIGVHQNYAPIVDLNHDYRNPIINYRTYSDNSHLATKHALALINGMENENLIATAKHFPGHGGTDLDSHKELPLILRSSLEYEKEDLVPFKYAIKEKVKSIMVGHLEVPSFEPEPGLPASLSENIVQKLLIDRMGFTGLVVTDALNMHAVRDHFTPEESAVKAIKSGVDLLLFPEDNIKTIEGLISAVNNHEIKEERINKSVRKILAAKKWLKLDHEVFVDYKKAKKIINNKSHIRLATEIGEKSITLLKNDKDIIPIKPVDYYATAMISFTDYSTKLDETPLFNELVEEHFNYIRSFELNAKSKNREYKRAMKFAKKANLIILPLFLTVRSFYGSIGLSDKNAEFLNEILKLNKPTVVVSLGNPYIINQINEPEVYLTSYGTADISQQAAFDALIGRSNISGKLPISIAKTNFKIGDGIQIKNDKLLRQEVEQDSLYDFSNVTKLMEEAITDSVFPGAVLLVSHKGRQVLHKPFGRYTYDEGSREMKTDAIFDLASVTKVVGTTAAAMLLYDKGLLDLEEKVSYYLPEFGNNGKEEIKIRNLLEHNAGLKAWQPFYRTTTDPEEVISIIFNSELEYEVGEKFVYSDWGMITLQKAIEKLSGQTLDQFLDENLFEKLEMKNTMFNPSPDKWFYCVPTEKDDYFRHTTVKGKVHDEAAYILNGVAGHAGLFSTSSDLSVFLQMMLNGGIYGNHRIFNEETVLNWTKKQSKLSTRALGWDTRSEEKSSSGRNFSFNSYGHTGFTGTSVWTDRDNELIVILLTNRVYPTRNNIKHIKFRPIIHDAIFNAIKYSFGE